MSPRWLEIRITVPPQAIDLVGQVLSDLGSVGVIVANQDLDTFVPPAPEDLEPAQFVRSFFPWPDDQARLEANILAELKSLQPLLPALAEAEISLECRELAAEDWATDWQQHFPPLQVTDRLVIAPSWAKWPEPAGVTVLRLDPGQAFGTGTHATTRLCLAVLADLFERQPRPVSVLDVGTGSGILAMSAAALGAQRVVACDIDPQACTIARDNATRNGLGAEIDISTAPLEDIPGRFDLILANILASENLRLARGFVEHLLPEGRLVLSGILDEQAGEVRQGLAAWPLHLIETRRQDEWVCMVYRRDD